MEYGSSEYQKEQDEHFNKKVRSAKHILYLVYFFLTFAILIPLLAYNGFMKPDIDKAGAWFQRSGSAMVLFAAFAEYYLFLLHSFINPSGFSMDRQEEFQVKFKHIHKKLSFLAVFFVISGTFIWGYGELLVRST